MYVDKHFKLKPVDEVKREVDSISDAYAERVHKVFLADGDAAIYPTEGLAEILEYMNKKNFLTYADTAHTAVRRLS